MDVFGTVIGIVANSLEIDLDFSPIAIQNDTKLIADLELDTAGEDIITIAVHMNLALNLVSKPQQSPIANRIRNTIAETGDITISALVELFNEFCGKKQSSRSCQ